MMKKCTKNTLFLRFWVGMTIKSLFFLALFLQTPSLFADNEDPKTDFIKIYNEDKLSELRGIPESDYIICYHEFFKKMHETTTPKIPYVAYADILQTPLPYVYAQRHIIEEKNQTKKLEVNVGLIVGAIDKTNGRIIILPDSERAFSALVRHELEDRHNPPSLGKGWHKKALEKAVKFEAIFDGERSTLSVYDSLDINLLLHPTLKEKYGLVGLELIRNKDIGKTALEYRDNCGDSGLDPEPSFVILKHPQIGLSYSRMTYSGTNPLLETYTEVERSKCAMFAKMTAEDIELARDLQNGPVYGQFVKAYTEDKKNKLIGKTAESALFVGEILLTGGTSALVRKGVSKVIQGTTKRMVTEYIARSVLSSAIVAVPKAVLEKAKSGESINGFDIVRETGIVFVNTVIFDGIFFGVKGLKATVQGRKGLFIPSTKPSIETGNPVSNLKAEEKKINAVKEAYEIQEGSKEEINKKINKQVFPNKKSAFFLQRSIQNSIKFFNKYGMKYRKIAWPGRPNETAFEILDFGKFGDDEFRSTVEKLKNEGLDFVVLPGKKRLIGAAVTNNIQINQGSRGIMLVPANSKVVLRAINHEAQHVFDWGEENMDKIFKQAARFLPDEIGDDYASKNWESLCRIIGMIKEDRAHSAIYNRFVSKLKNKNWSIIPVEIRDLMIPGSVFNEIGYEALTTFKLAQAVYVINPRNPEISYLILQSMGRLGEGVYIAVGAVYLSKLVLSDSFETMKDLLGEEESDQDDAQETESNGLEIGLPSQEENQTE